MRAWEWALWVQAYCWLYKGEEGTVLCQGGYQIRPGETKPYHIISIEPFQLA